MSQSAVGSVYGKVIEAVCEQSQIDFEEGGVDQGALDLLKSGWQKRLSELKVAQLPWEPTPTLTPAQHTPSISSNAVKPQPQSQPQPQPQPLPSNGNPVPTPSSSSAAPGPRIKPEPGSYPSPVPQPNGYPMATMPQYPPGIVPTAHQRAAMNLQQQYGQQAARQINQLHQQSSQQRPQGLPPLNHPKPEDQKPNLSGLANYPPAMSQTPKAPVNSAQTDGAGDSLAEWKAEVARRRELAARSEGGRDRLLHEDFMEIQHRLEGGGLMIPLEDRRMPKHGTKRKINEMGARESSKLSAESAEILSAADVSSLPKAQGDAAGDEEEEEEEEADEDAINSDLDDPDQADDDENSEENTDQVMLCTWDKVQRVKNKWKCTLKDGIFRVGGIDYVFHKGQGEFEW